MKKYLAILFFLLPFVAQAQLTAVNPDDVKPTQWLTGNPEHVFVFFDKTTATLTARDTGGIASTFTWRFLNPRDTSVTEQKGPDGGFSSLNITKDGGYQVQIKNDLRDTTFSCWVFFDNFKIDTVEAFNDCNRLQLKMKTTPGRYYDYTIYNFEEFLNSPSHIDYFTYRDWQSIYWDSDKNIHEGVKDADESWKQRNNTYNTIIDNPPPLYASSYTVKVTDVFGKSASYTTPYAVDAIAVYPQAKVEKVDDFIAGTWEDAGTAIPNYEGEKVPLSLDGEALLRLKFSHGNSINTDSYIWKGFANAAARNGDRTLVWTDATKSADTIVYPRMPHKGQIVNGYTPGSYTVRLVVNNSYCIDSAEVEITVAPSKLDAEAIPNAFTPNGDMQNDYFIFVKDKEPVSMEYIRVYVYNRSGGLVYRYEGAADAWTGWDGRFMGTGNDVAEGVYFYIINGEGWDGVQHNTSEYKGSVHLFR